MNCRESELLAAQSDLIAKSIYHPPVNTHQFRLQIIMFAHANWPKLAPLFLAQVRYAEAEGIELMKMWEDAIRKSIMEGVSK